MDTGGGGGGWVINVVSTKQKLLKTVTVSKYFDTYRNGKINEMENCTLQINNFMIG